MVLKENKLKIPNQEKVWDEISVDWKTLRVKPFQEVVEFLKDKKGKILDLGCGSGRNFVKTSGIIYGVDFSKEQLNYAALYAKEKGFNVILNKSNVFDLKFKDNFFDAAIFIATLHCISGANQRERSLKEMFRVMKKGAKVLITVWDKNQPKFGKAKKEIILSWTNNGKRRLRYYYLYEKDELAKLLKKIGFKIEKIIDKENSESKNSKRNIIIVAKK